MIEALKVLTFTLLQFLQLYLLNVLHLEVPHLKGFHTQLFCFKSQTAYCGLAGPGCILPVIWVGSDLVIANRIPHTLNELYHLIFK